MESLRAFVTDATALSGAVQATAGALAVDPDVRQLRGLRAALAGYSGDVRRLRADLDGGDIRDALAHEWPEDVIRAWQLERRSRQALVQAAVQIRAADDVAEALERGARLRQYVARSGDTWQSVAARLLGDWREWPRLVEANDGDPSVLPAGTVLVVPRR